jgi:hypothetical protein
MKANNLAQPSPPNGPELSCGDVQLRTGSLLRVPVLYDVLVISFTRGEKARRNFRQLERLVRPRYGILMSRHTLTD